MTEDGRDYGPPVGLIDSLVTPPMFKSAAGWITESKHLPEAFRPEPFLLAAISSLLLHVCLVLSRFPDHIEVVLRLPSPF